MGQATEPTVKLERTGHLYLDSSPGPGPAITRLRRRALLTWALVVGMGQLPGLLGAPFAWAVLGFGAWFPGAGFLLIGYPWLTGLTLLALLLSLAAWLIVGGFIFPLLVWLGSAIAAAVLGASGSAGAWTDVQWLVPGLVVLGTVTLEVRGRITARRRAAEALSVRDHLSRIPMVEPELRLTPAGELSASEVGAMRYMLDMALQPIERFEDFTTIDQFREAAWRYQLVSLNYALSLLQINRLPAFRGCVQEAQRNAITKMLDHRVWKYWATENFVGNLRLDSDPIRKDNVMYSGWWALALGAFERATGDRRFSSPGALTLKHPRGREFRYDFPMLVDALCRNFDSAPLCFFPCEPNFVFSICNLFAFTGITLFDREHGSGFALERHERFVATMEREFTFGDGRAVAIASNRTGLLVAPDNSMVLQANPWLLNMVSPRLAQVYWALGRRHLLRGKQTASDIEEPTGSARVDPGNYRQNGAFFWASIMASAREMGDEELYAVAAGRLGEGIEHDGSMRWPGSVYANLTSHCGRFGSKDAWHRMAFGDMPDAIRNGPSLDDAPYPQVVVTHANNDGAQLTCILEASHESVVPLRFGRLLAGRRYTLTASGKTAALMADGQGNAACSVVMTGRTPLTLTPVP